MLQDTGFDETRRVSLSPNLSLFFQEASTFHSYPPVATCLCVALACGLHHGWCDAEAGVRSELPRYCEMQQDAGALYSSISLICSMSFYLLLVCSLSASHPPGRPTSHTTSSAAIRIPMTLRPEWLPTLMSSTAEASAKTAFAEVGLQHCALTPPTHCVLHGEVH